MDTKFDILVIGAGHAGIEAALAGSRLGLSTLVLTQNLDRIGFMSCNPSIGGLGKGHIVREVDCLGGEMGRAADETCIQFKRLNSRKGPAVRGSRTQNDKELYAEYMGAFLRNAPNVQIMGCEVKELIVENNVCVGVRTDEGLSIFARAVVVTTGTFMRGVMHFGLEQKEGGRVGDKASVGLSDQLRSLGFSVRRLKTGTPPRLEKESIDWSKTIPQFGDETFYPFSIKSERKLKLEQIACYLSHTNEKTHDVIRKNLHKSPMYCGVIEGVGPRYCPSIEDKITRFKDKISHQTFLEPESFRTNSIYLQGISTSLPPDVQMEFLKTIHGLENVRMLRPGYAVEYDFIEPTQLWPWLETRAIANLFLAGQINGTSGYEEAAGQGLLAGVNAGLKLLEKEPLVLGRDQAYLGVLVDDLVTKGADEPYRMFTARAEHRLILREDNTVERLIDLSFKLGLITPETYDRVQTVREKQNKFREELRTRKLTPTADTLRRLSEVGSQVIQKQISFEELLRRDEIHCFNLERFDFELPGTVEELEPVEIEIKYAGYIYRQKELIAQTKKLEETRLPADLPYEEVRGLSREEVEKLYRFKPMSLGMASRISGVNPSAIQALLVFLKSRRQETGAAIGR